MVPKIIHYIWIGDEPFEWSDENKLFMLDYKIMKWGNKAVNLFLDNPTFKKLYENKKYGLCCNYIKLYALSKYGGIYIDTDIDLYDTFDKILKLRRYIGFASHDNDTNYTKINGNIITTSIIGCEPNDFLIKQFYQNLKNNIYFGRYDYSELMFTQLIKQCYIYDVANSINEAINLELKNIIPIFNNPYFDIYNPEKDYSICTHYNYLSWK